LTDAEFLTYVHNTMRAMFPEGEGWQIIRQPTSTTGTKPDFLIKRFESEIHAVDAEDKERLEKSDIDRLSDCTTELRTHDAMIFTAYETEVPSDVAEYAKTKQIEIIRTQWWQDE